MKPLNTFYAASLTAALLGTSAFSADPDIENFSVHLACRGTFSSTSTGLHPLNLGEVKKEISDEMDYYKIERGVFVEGTTVEEIIGMNISDLTETYLDIPLKGTRISRVDGVFGIQDENGRIKTRTTHKIDGVSEFVFHYDVHCIPVTPSF